MKAFVYPLWRNQYYFHPDSTANPQFLAFYHPYSWKLQTFYELWKNASLVRLLRTMDTGSSDEFNTILKAIPDLENAVWVIDTGRHSVHRKVSGIYCGDRDADATMRFFKLGFTRYSKDAVAREASFYKSVSHSGLTPAVFATMNEPDYTAYVGEYISGRKLEHFEITKKITSTIEMLSEMRFSGVINYNVNASLMVSFAHGDFCPWNILVTDDGEYKIIDWEFAGVYPRGFDFLTFKIQVPFLMERRKSVAQIWMSARSEVKRYFEHYAIENWMDYVREFANICATRQNGGYLGKRYLELKHWLN